MPGYLVKFENIDVDGVASLQIRSLLDRQQYDDPLGAAAALGISSALWPLFGLLWPSGRFLAAALARRPVRPAERILELGCGLALASLVAHRRGSDVTASDRHPMTEAFLHRNLALNALSPLRYLHGDWACSAASETAAAAAAARELIARVAAGAGAALAEPVQALVQGRYDLIVGSDVLYERDDLGQLPQFIERHACAACEVIIVDPQRGNRAPFHRRMADLGYTWHETRLDEPGGPGPAYRGRLFHYQRGAARPAATGHAHGQN